MKYLFETKILTGEEIHEVWIRYNEETTHPENKSIAEETLMSVFQGYIEDICNRYLPDWKGHPDAEDICSAGYLAICDGIRSYRADMGASLGTYVFGKVKAAVLTEMCRKNNPTDIPRQSLAYHRKAERLMMCYADLPYKERMEKVLEIFRHSCPGAKINTVKSLEKLLQLPSRTVSLDRLTVDESGEKHETLRDRLYTKLDPSAYLEREEDIRFAKFFAREKLDTRTKENYRFLMHYFRVQDELSVYSGKEAAEMRKILIQQIAEECGLSPKAVQKKAAQLCDKLSSESGSWHLSPMACGKDAPWIEFYYDEDGRWRRRSKHIR